MDRLFEQASPGVPTAGLYFFMHREDLDMGFGTAISSQKEA